MHSSRMRTARSFTVSCHILCMLPKPRMPPIPQQPCTPPSNHACPPQPHTPCNHACPPATMHAPTTMHAPPAAMHAPPQPHMPPQQPRMPPLNRMTNRCKNIILPQTSFAGGNKRSGSICTWEITAFRISRRVGVSALYLPIEGKVLFSEASVCPQGERSDSKVGSASVGGGSAHPPSTDI